MKRRSPGLPSAALAAPIAVHRAAIFRSKRSIGGGHDCGRVTLSTAEATIEGAIASKFSLVELTTLISEPRSPFVLARSFP